MGARLRHVSNTKPPPLGEARGGRNRGSLQGGNTAAGEKTSTQMWTSSPPSGLPGIPSSFFEVVVNESQTPVCPNLAAVLIISARLKGSCQLACTKTNQPRNKQNKKVRQTHSTCSTVSQCGCGCGMSTKFLKKTQNKTAEVS